MTEDEALKQKLVEIVIRKSSFNNDEDKQCWCIDVVCNLNGNPGMHQYKRALKKLWDRLNPVKVTGS